MALAPEDIRQAGGEDAPLVELLRNSGDEAVAAFAELYRKYRTPLLRRVRRKVGSSDLAEEIVQDAFVRAWKAAERFAGPGHFYGWLCTIADRLCVDNWRRARNREEPVGDNHDERAATGRDEPEAHAIALSDAEEVRSAFKRLSPRYQELLRLREIEGLSYRHVAQRMAMSESAVETALFRARGALRTSYRAVAGRPLAVMAVLAAAWSALRRMARHSTTPIAALPAAVAVVATVALVATSPSPAPTIEVTWEPVPARAAVSSAAPASAMAPAAQQQPEVAPSAPVAVPPAHPSAMTAVEENAPPEPGGATVLPESVVVENPALGPVECDCGAEVSGLAWAEEKLRDPIGLVTDPPEIAITIPPTLHDTEE